MASDYMQMIHLVEDYYGSGSDQWLKIVGGKGVTPDELLSILRQTPGVNVITNQAGEYRGWTLKNTSSITTVKDIGNAVDSNIVGGTDGINSLATINTPADMTVDAATGLVTVKNSSSIWGQWVTKGGVSGAIGAVSTGLALGVTIDKTLYTIDHDIFGDDKLANFNPEKWKSISDAVDEGWTDMGYPTVGKIGRFVVDHILGIDSSTGKTQMYLDEDAFTYSAQYLQSIGAFDFKDICTIGDLPVSALQFPNGYGNVYTGDNGGSIYIQNRSTAGIRETFSITSIDVVKYVNVVYISPIGSVNVWGVMMSKSPFTGHRVEDNYFNPSTGEVSGVSTYTFNNRYTTTLTDGTTIYYYTYQIGSENVPYQVSPDSTIVNGPKDDAWSVRDIIRIVFEGTTSTTGVEGVGTQKSSTLPDFSTATDFDSFKTLLKQQYPDMWSKSITQNVLQPDGSMKTFTYIPVPTPNSSGWLDTEPTGDGSEQSQTSTSVSDDSSESIKDTIISSSTNTPTDPNPPGTGGGDSPTVVPPVGSASSLWSIYNPTLEQVNQFGSWLWSSNFVEQLKKLFNDPMQAIIGLHKVYSPVQTSGLGTIKCGYLDSEVPSKLVNDQYVTVDCGSVDLQEYFGNVFDYSPYTSVSIYLPFIGIRQLDVSDIMRSTITVTYHVDVLTGACLAEVNVQRDASGGALYTFSGDAAVRYPVSSGSYMGIVSGLIGVATSVVSGNVLPALGGITRLHTDVDHSGSFTGNAGAMGSKIPYLIISRPQTAMADSFETLSGYPSNTYTPISACTGFTQVKYVHVENLTATETEKQEIERLLKEGVIV